MIGAGDPVDVVAADEADWNENARNPRRLDGGVELNAVADVLREAELLAEHDDAHSHSLVPPFRLELPHELFSLRLHPVVAASAHIDVEHRQTLFSARHQ